MIPDRTETAQQTKQRRDTLKTAPNTSQGLDYISVLYEPAITGTPEITIKYVPDKLIVAADCVTAYVAALQAAPPISLEQFALDILADINNEIVPRWCQVVVKAGTPEAGDSARYIIVEDRQPNWDNATLLSRIAPL